MHGKFFSHDRSLLRSCNILEIKLFVLSMRGLRWYTATAIGNNGTESGGMRMYDESFSKEPKINYWGKFDVR